MPATLRGELGMCGQSTASSHGSDLSQITLQSFSCACEKERATGITLRRAALTNTEAFLRLSLQVKPCLPAALHCLDGKLFILKSTEKIHLCLFSKPQVRGWLKCGVTGLEGTTTSE